MEIESHKEQLRKEVVEIQEWKTLLDSVNARCYEVVNSEIHKIASELDMTDCLPISDYEKWVNDFDATLEKQGIEELKDFVSLMRIDCAQKTANYLSDISDSIKKELFKPAVSPEDLEFFMQFMPIRYKELYRALNLLGEKSVNVVLSVESPKTYNLLYDAYKAKNPELFEEICIAEDVSRACRYIYREILLLPGIMERVDSEIEKRHFSMDQTAVLFDASPDTELNRWADPIMDLLEKHEYNPLCDEMLQNTKLLGYMKGLCLSFVHDSELPKGMNLRLKREWRKFEPFFERYDTVEANEIVDESYQDSIVEDRVTIAQEVVQEYIETAHSDMNESQGTAPMQETANPMPSNSTNDLSATTKLNDRFSQFPTRLIAVKGVYAQSYNDILKAIFDKFNFFENMSAEDFIYLFGGLGSCPSSYNPPFYWSADEGILKAIIRILYVRQPRNLNKLILRVADKGIGCSSHKWSTNKNKVAYFDIETQIIDIVKQVCGAELPRL